MTGEPGTVDAHGTGIAILGGSFNPPHSSHLRLAAAARRCLPVNEVRVIPAGDHPHKGTRLVAATHRLAMCRLAFAWLADVVVDDRELRRPGPSYTVDTLAELQREHPGRRLFFLIGSDNLPLLTTWHDHHRILALATVVTYPRAGHPVDPARLDAQRLTSAERSELLAHVLDLPADAVAASDLRRRWHAGERELDEIPAPVRTYMRTHGLYADAAP